MHGILYHLYSMQLFISPPLPQCGLGGGRGALVIQYLYCLKSIISISLTEENIILYSTLRTISMLHPGDPSKSKIFKKYLLGSVKGTGTQDLIWLKGRAYGRPLKIFKVLLYIFY